MTGAQEMKDQPYTKMSADVDGRHQKTLDRLSTETRAAVERAGIVLVPDEGFRDRRVSIDLRHSSVEFTEFCFLGVC
jgi:hypothetical protein